MLSVVLLCIWTWGGGVGAKIDYVIFALFCRIKNKSEVSLNSSLFAEKTYSIGFFQKLKSNAFKITEEIDKCFF